MANPPETDAPRTVGRYTLFQEIASGGMATVHLGRLNGPVGFARTVAIKRLHPHLAKDPEFVAMLLDEARVAARVRHPNVVQTLDVVATDGEVFLVMEYVTGESFARLLRRARTDQVDVPPQIAAAVVASTLHGLHAAHEAQGDRGEPLGIVHRDVSPQNVIVGLDGVARVLDFGIAKAAGRLQETREGELKGKLAYMAPEQLSGGSVTRRCDIYASGILLWEALVGDYLFRADTEAATLAKAADARVSPPSDRRKGLDPAFDAIVLRALAKEPGRRYPTAREMALDIERSVPVAAPSEVGEWVLSLVGSDLERQTELLSSIASDEGETGDGLSGTKRRWRIRSRTRQTLTWATAGAIVLLGVALAVRPRHSPPSDPQLLREPPSAAADPPPPAVPVDTAVVPTPTEEPAPPAVQKRSTTNSGRPARGNESRPAPPARVRPGCDPPFATDEKGHRHYKAECL